MIYMLKCPCGLICIAKTLGAWKQSIRVQDRSTISIELQISRHSDLANNLAPSLLAHIAFIGFDNFSPIIRKEVRGLGVE